MVKYKQQIYFIVVTYNFGFFVKNSGQKQKPLEK